MKDRDANECNQWREVFRAPSELDEICEGVTRNAPTRKRKRSPGMKHEESHGEGSFSVLKDSQSFAVRQHCLDPRRLGHEFIDGALFGGWVEVTEVPTIFMSLLGYTKAPKELAVT